MNEITWDKKALKQFGKLPADAKAQIRPEVEKLLNWPDVQGVKKLVNRNDYRLRVGRFRVIFSVAPNGTAVILTIEEVKKRDEHTYS